MAKITIDIPDNQISRILNIAEKVGYQSKIEVYEEGGGFTLQDNPQTKGDFIKRLMINYIKNLVLNVEREEAQRAISADNLDIS
jgi:hypothetical protein